MDKFLHRYSGHNSLYSHLLLSNNNNNNNDSNYAERIILQEIWANAHKTCESI